MITSRTNQSLLSNKVNTAQQALPYSQSIYVMQATHTCDISVMVYSTVFSQRKAIQQERKNLSERLIRIHSLTTSLLLFPSSLLVAPPGFPWRAKTNNSAKQGSIRPGSSVALASHLPGRGLTSQAASRALSWTSST